MPFVQNNSNQTKHVWKGIRAFVVLTNYKERFQWAKCNVKWTAIDDWKRVINDSKCAQFFYL